MVAGRGLSSSPFGPLHRAAWVSSRHGSWLPPGQEMWEQQGRSRSVFYDPTSEVTCHNFHRILWVTQVSPVQGGKGYRRDGHHTRSIESVEPLLGLQERQAAQDASWGFTGEPKTKLETCWMFSVGFLATHWRVIPSETEEQILPLLEDVGDLVVLWTQQTHICVRSGDTKLAVPLPREKHPCGPLTLFPFRL